MTLRILTGDCRAVLATLPDESVHMVVTSPPYWGLRDYKVPPSVWEGDADCEHEWEHEKPVLTGRNDTDRETPGGRGGSFRGGPRGEATSGAVCYHCGAWYGVLGLEPSPELHVEHIVEIFRAVRRVLRKDGTLWLNYGDSYAGGGGFSPNAPSTPFSKSGKYGAALKEGGIKPVNGLKAKDLVMMPARIALALQQPYYTGQIRDERDRIWLAAMIDGEGCMFIHKRKVGQENGNGYKRKNASYGAGLEVANCSQAIVDRCLAITGKGSISRHEKGRRRPLYRWQLRSNQCRNIIREVYPYLVAKQHEARLLIGCPSSGDLASEAHVGLMALHSGQSPKIDFPAPPSMFEPGWYLRSEVVWAKKNPMPESITDRPTSSHEKVFLLTKSARYFYDAEAVRTESKSPGRVVSYDGSQKTTNHQNRTYPGAKPRDIVVAPRSNLRNVWHIATHPYPDAHFATFPPALVEPCIKAGTSEKGVCGACGAPWVRELSKATGGQTGQSWHPHDDDDATGNDKEWTATGDTRRPECTYEPPETIGWSPSCKCTLPNNIHATATVLDPFGGSGTVGLVADRLGRDAILIELNSEYADMARARIQQDSPLFAEVG